MRYAQLVMGPAGCGKSTYCSGIVKHAEVLKRTVKVVNLDPAAEYFDYPMIGDMRDLISVDDVMTDEALKFGPNGALVFCMEYLIENTDWLEEVLGDDDDDYVLFDCPGQIELYTHMPIMKHIVEMLQRLNFNLCGIFLLDAQFMIDGSKYLSGVMTALSTMVNLEISHVNILSKMDLLSKSSKKQLERFLQPGADIINNDVTDTHWNEKYMKLNEAIGNMIDDYSLVRFVPLNMKEEESITDVLMYIDNIIQYGEDADVKIQDFDDPEPINGKNM